MTKKQDVKNAAFMLFARKGYSETSMDDIAKTLNLKKQSLYSHFESKAEIFSEILQEQCSIMANEIGKKLKELSEQPAESLMKGFLRVLSACFQIATGYCFGKE
jgi:AcrR family transcriptional regulator